MIVKTMDHLTKSQQKVYDFLRKEAPRGVPPTVREICAATGLRSTSTVHAHLKTLERLGYITRDAGLNRSIRLEGSEAAAQVPILGKVTAGIPILAVEDIEGYIPFPQKEGKELFALHVSGLSMRDAGILDGDYVVAEKDSYLFGWRNCGGHDRGGSHSKNGSTGKAAAYAFSPKNPDSSLSMQKNVIYSGQSNCRCAVLLSRSGGFRQISRVPGREPSGPPGQTFSQLNLYESGVRCSFAAHSFFNRGRFRMHLPPHRYGSARKYSFNGSR